MRVDRRTFLAGTSAAAAGVCISRNALASSDTEGIRVAVIGVKGRGRSHIQGFEANVVALCDVDEKILDERVSEFGTKFGRKLDRYVDFRKLLERDDIDAVSIATPNHTHSLIGVAACEAGKDVYCEKPVSHNVWEGRQLVNASRIHERIVQCGTQSRSSVALQKAVQFVRDGGLGRVKYALGTCYKPRKPIGKLDKPRKMEPHINYDLWCGPAEKRELFRPQLHYDWHWDFNTGNGDMGNQGIHQMDIARWFLGYNTLSPRVLSIGGRLGYEDAGDTPNTQVVIHDYADAPLIFETRGLPRSKKGQAHWKESMDEYRGSRIGVIVQCEKGYIVVPSYSSAAAFDLKGEKIEEWQGGGDHFTNFLDAVVHRDRNQLHAEILDGHLSSGLCHTGSISHRMGKNAGPEEIREQIGDNQLLLDSFERMADHLTKNRVDVAHGALTLGTWLEMNTASESFESNDRANQMLTREYRKGFEVPELTLETIQG